MRVNDTSPILTIDGKIATIAFNKPEFANRLSPSDLEILRAHIQTVNISEEVLVLKIVSSGQYFCSGYDISSLASDEAPSSTFFGDVVDEVENCRAVTIAVIQGGVYGGGTDLCLACDFRFGTKQVNMFMPAVKFGLHFYPGGMRRYINCLGLNNAKKLFLTAEKIGAEEMYQMGFITHLVQEQDLQQAAAELADKLSQMAPIALLGIKKHLNLIAKGVEKTEEILEAVRISEASEDMKEGALAWKEKRKPNFSGQ